METELDQPRVIDRVPVRDLRFYPGNPRRGNIAMIAESLKVNTQYKALTVQKSTNFVLCGNHTLQAAISLGYERIDVVYLDCDDVTAKRIVLADNKTADSATYDVDDLAEFLADVEDFQGTGWTSDDVARMSSELPPEFPRLDPDAAPAPAKPPACPDCGQRLTCPDCGHQ